jgi:NAD(P)-dependent dehydrogenase (short-subunit alcohol dehydrogenase family)
LALVRRLASEGARIAFVARDHTAVERVAKETGALGIAGDIGYGASKAALRHLTAIWAEEAKADRVGFLSFDPGDMDTPLHALALPDADRSTLKRPEHAADEIVDAMRVALSTRVEHLIEAQA